MTKTEFMTRQLSETERANRANEQLKKTGNIINLVTGLTGALLPKWSIKSNLPIGRKDKINSLGNAGNSPELEKRLAILAERKAKGERLEGKDWTEYLKFFDPKTNERRN